MKIVFLGTPDYVQPIKDELAKHFSLVGSLNEANLCVVAAYGRILTKDELETPKYGCINVHPSLLPKYRGPTPIQSAILNGDKITGITIIKMDEKVDHGPIITTREVRLLGQENFLFLINKLFQLGAELLVDIIPDYIAGKIKLVPQNHPKATYTKILKKEDGYFDIENPPDPQTLDRMIRAYYPWPGVWTKWSPTRHPDPDEYRGKDLKIVKFLPGGLIQMEGKKPLSKKDFLNGYPDFPLKF